MHRPAKSSRQSKNRQHKLNRVQNRARLQVERLEARELMAGNVFQTLTADWALAKPPTSLTLPGTTMMKAKAPNVVESGLIDLRVNVVDASGKRLKDVTVELVRRGDKPLTLTAKTSAQGIAWFYNQQTTRGNLPLAYEARVNSPGYQSDWMKFTPGQKAVDLVARSETKIQLETPAQAFLGERLKGEIAVTLSPEQAGRMNGYFGLFGGKPIEMKVAFAVRVNGVERRSPVFVTTFHHGQTSQTFELDLHFGQGISVSPDMLGKTIEVYAIVKETSTQPTREVLSPVKSVTIAMPTFNLVVDAVDDLTGEKVTDVQFELRAFGTSQNLPPVSRTLGGDRWEKLPLREVTGNQEQALMYELKGKRNGEQVYIDVLYLPAPAGETVQRTARISRRFDLQVNVTDYVGKEVIHFGGIPISIEAVQPDGNGRTVGYNNHGSFNLQLSQNGQPIEYRITVATEGYQVFQTTFTPSRNGGLRTIDIKLRPLETASHHATGNWIVVHGDTNPLIEFANEYRVSLQNLLQFENGAVSGGAVVGTFTATGIRRYDQLVVSHEVCPIISARAIPGMIELEIERQGRRQLLYLELVRDPLQRLDIYAGPSHVSYLIYQMYQD